MKNFKGNWIHWEGCLVKKCKRGMQNSWRKNASKSIYNRQTASFWACFG